MLEGLKKLELAIKIEEKKLMKRDEMDRLPSLIFNKRFRERKKPGPKVDWWKRKRKIEALVSRLKCQEIIGKVSAALIENWLPSHKLGYGMDHGEDDTPIPRWYISRGFNLPRITTVYFYLKTEFKKGKPINPHLKIVINFTPKITLCRLFRTITVDKVYEQIIYMFYEVYGEFAKKKGILLSRPKRIYL